MQNLNIIEILANAVKRRASDIHITVGRPPVMRVNDELVNMAYEPLEYESARDLIYSFLTEQQKEIFESEFELDLAYDLGEVGRFRVSVYKQKGVMGAAFRPIASKIPTLETLGLPGILADLAMYPSGFIVVTGPTGCGKSTTLAAMIDVINTKRRCHIVTMEDPVEYLHHHKNSVITQREIGSDTHSFNAALKHVLRQNPDVILVGEVRDQESMGMALTAAETGHLVLTTLHTMDAPQTIERIIDFFAAQQQQQVLMQLSGALRAVIAQILMPRATGGLITAQEIMIATPGIRNLIRKGEIHQLYQMIQVGKQLGMQTMNQCLRDMVSSRKVTREVALAYTPNPEELRQLLDSA